MFMFWIIEKLSGVLYIAGPVILLWGTWWIRKFWIRPLLYPKEARALPYFIPYLGHAISFLTGLDGLFDHARRYFRNTQETYSLTVAGQRIYIMTSPTNISGALLRGLKDATYDRNTPYFQLMHQFGISDHAINILRDHPETEFFQKNDLGPDIKPKTTIDMAHVFARQQLHPGETYADFESVFLRVIDKALRWETIPHKAKIQPDSSVSSSNLCNHPKSPIDSSTTTQSVSLLELVHQAIVGATTEAFFGPAMLDRVDPSYVDNYSHFDDNVFAFLCKLPGLRSAGCTSVKKLRRAVEAYLEMPDDERCRSEASWMATTTEVEMTARGISRQDIAGWLVIIHWGMSSNTWRYVFWIAAHIAHDQDLQNSIRREVEPHIPPDSTAPNYLQMLKKALTKECPRLNSLYNEVLRFYNSPSSVRVISKDTVTATGEALRAPALLMIPHRQLLLDDTSPSSPWGPTARSFDAARFLRVPTTPRPSAATTAIGTTIQDTDRPHEADPHPQAKPELQASLITNNKYFTPYGGGPTLCPGRFMVKSGALVFVALLVTRFDISTTGPLPRADPQSKSGLGVGILGARDGEDSIMRLTPRIVGKNASGVE